MDFLEIVTVLSAATVAFIALCLTLLAWRASHAAPVLLYEMLDRQGGAVAHLALASEGRSFGMAVRQCVACPSKLRCRAWLESGNRDGYEAFCANTGYVTRLRSLAARR
jgi:Family of unknown function (DUF6455)